jgi:hypothetical protein
MAIRLDDLISDKKPIYVRNKTKPRGRVDITFADPGTRRVISVTVPRTLLPICISEEVPSEAIANSTDFRRFLGKRILELVDPEDAEELLSSSDAQEELRALKESEFSTDAPVTKDQKHPGVANEGNMNEGDPGMFDNSFEAESALINPRVLQITASLATEDTGVRQAMQELRAMEDQLGEIECSYIIANGPDGQIRQFAQKVMSNLTTERVK